MAIHWFGISRTNTGYPELSSQSVHAKKYSYAHHSYFFVIVEFIDRKLEGSVFPPVIQLQWFIYNLTYLAAL